jgi:hypothetical protein
LGIGTIHIEKNNIVRFQIPGLNELIKILLPHFEKYPLLTKKAEDFILFQQVIEIMNTKEHLTIEGLRKIINIRASMN